MDTCEAISGTFRPSFSWCRSISSRPAPKCNLVSVLYDPRLRILVTRLRVVLGPKKCPASLPDRTDPSNNQPPPGPDTRPPEPAMAAPDDDRGPLDAADRTGTSGTAPAGSWRGSTSEARDGPTEEKKKPGRLASIVARLGLDPVTIISMVK